MSTNRFDYRTPCRREVEQLQVEELLLCDGQHGRLARDFVQIIQPIYPDKEQYTYFITQRQETRRSVSSFRLTPQGTGCGYPQHDARGQDAQQAVAVAEISNLGPQVYSVPDTPSSTPTRRSSRDLYAIFSDFLVLAVDMPTQSRPDTRLQIGAIYLLLFIRDRDPAKGFHSALYHHRTTHGGYKFNVKQMGSGWICDSAPNNGIMQSFLLDVALRIGFCDPGPTGVEALAWIDEVCLIEPPAPFDTFNCRTWTLHCVRGLVERGFVRCDDLDALEQEAKEWATLHHESAHEGVMPRPVEDSRVCTL